MKDEEKKSRINESESAGMAAEPVGAATRSDVIVNGAITASTDKPCQQSLHREWRGENADFIRHH